MSSDQAILPLTVALTLWEIGLVSEAKLLAWADAQILKQTNPAIDLLELSAQGPQRCLSNSAIDFDTAPLQLMFLEEFSLRASFLDLSSDREAIQFISWVSDHCWEPDINQPEVNLAYRIEHCFHDLDDLPTALQLLRDELPTLLARCCEVAAAFLIQVPDLIAPRRSDCDHRDYSRYPMS
jgi:hypothetical protein